MKKRLLCLICMMLALAMLVTACSMLPGSSKKDDKKSSKTEEAEDEEEEEGNKRNGKDAEEEEEFGDLSEYLGTFVSSGDTKDSITLNEDGTCDVNGNTYYWTRETIEKGFFQIQDKGGEFLFFFRTTFNENHDMGYVLYGLIPNMEGSLLSKRSTGKAFYPQEVIDAMGGGSAMEELLTYIGGTWTLGTDAEDVSTELTVDETTVTWGDKSYEYTIDEWYLQNYQGGFPNNGIYLKLYEDDGTEAMSINFYLYYPNYDDQTLAFYSAEVYQNDNWYRFYKGEKIALTMDNWQEYIEPTEWVNVSYDSFNEVSSIYWVMGLKLKPEYQRKLVAFNIPIEYTVSVGVAKHITYDTSNDTFTITDLETAPEGIYVRDDSSYSNTDSIWNLFTGYTITSYGVYSKDKMEVSGTTYSGDVAGYKTISVDRISGYIFLAEPAEVEAK